MTHAPGLRECFDALADLPAHARAAWLDAHGIDAALREQLEKMLAADGIDDAAVPLLGAGAAAVAAAFTPEAEHGDGLIGTQVGPYRLVAILGHGGTSVVFRAERPIGAGTQTVALKLLRTGLFSADAQRRFRREQGVLAQLSHPNIAGLIDGGISDGGIPYLATEFVDGATITDHANARALDLDARLRLVATVCRAVDGAHRALVVHRDLKPSNVLVSRDGAVKVLDFGIAQLVDDGGADVAPTQSIALTPGYAAPEQYRPGPVTTATDVYALGVLLAELLTGRPALPAAHAASTLSRRVGDGAPAGLPAPATLRRALRGDLDAIHATACAHEPQRRYGSAALLADDIDRYLARLPVAARAPSFAYRVRKYVTRNRLGAVAVAAVALAVATGIAATLWQARVAREESRRATAVSQFLLGLFEASKQGRLPEQRLTLEEIVRRAGERLQRDGELSAATRVDLTGMLGEVALAASDLPQAERLVDRALELARAAPADDAALLRVRLLRAQLLTLQTRYADAAAAYEAVLAQIHDAKDAQGIRALQNYAFALMFSARAQPALAVSTQALRAATAFFGAGSQGAVLASIEHGDMLLGAGRAAAAIAVVEPALARWRDAAWPPDREYARGLNNLTRAYHALGDTGTAERYARENLATAERLYQPPHEQIALALNNLADLLFVRERLDEVEPLLARALAMFRTVYGEGQMRDSNTLRRIGLLQWRRGDLAAAAASLRQARQWCDRPGLHATRSCLEIDSTQARIALARGEVREADAISARGLAMAREIYRDGSGSTAELLQLRAAVQLADGDAAAALASCDAAQAMLRALDETRGTSAVSVAARRGEVLAALRRHAEALADVDAALSLSRGLAPDGWRRRVELLALRAQVQMASGDAAGARATAREALGLVEARQQVDPARLAVIVRLGAEASARR